MAMVSQSNAEHSYQLIPTQYDKKSQPLPDLFIKKIFWSALSELLSQSLSYVMPQWAKVISKNKI
jgi:hypothetical protein